MARTMIDLDEEALAAAQERLGTKTKVHTVNEALRRAAAPPNQVPAMRALRMILALATDIDKPEVMDNAWRGTPQPESSKLRERTA